MSLDYVAEVDHVRSGLWRAEITLWNVQDRRQKHLHSRPLRGRLQIAELSLAAWVELPSCLRLLADRGVLRAGVVAR
jgi:hypothetical protein